MCGFYNANKKTLIFPILVTLLLLRKYIIIKEIYKRKHLIGDLFAVLEGDSMTIKDGA